MKSMKLTDMPIDELLRISNALENGFYHKSGYAPSNEEPKFWGARTFSVKYVEGRWCFAKITGGHTYNKSEKNLGFAFDYLIVDIFSDSWALTKEALK